MSEKIKINWVVEFHEFKWKWVIYKTHEEGLPEKETRKLFDKYSAARQWAIEKIRAEIADKRNNLEQIITATKNDYQTVK